MGCRENLLATIEDTKYFPRMRGLSGNVSVLIILRLVFPTDTWVVGLHSVVAGLGLRISHGFRGLSGVHRVSHSKGCVYPTYSWVVATLINANQFEYNASRESVGCRLALSEARLDE